jgi:hypothetical protein
MAQALRVAAAALGVVAIIIGLVYATRVFGMAFTALRDPVGFGEHVEQWVAAVGGDQLDIVVENVTLRPARPVALMVLGGGTAILAWIAIGITLAGAKTLSWTLGDGEAVRKLLVHAFGATAAPESSRPGGTPPTTRV